MEYDTANCKTVEDSSLILSLTHVLHVISFLKLNLGIFCACKDSTQNSSKIQDKISAASYSRISEKLGFLDLVTTPFKNRRNWDGSKGDLEDFNNDVILTKEDVNGERELLQKVKFYRNCSIVLRHWKEAFM